MSKPKKSTIEVQGADITVLSKEHGDYISLTDMAKKFGDDVLIYRWMRNRITLELIGIWEQIHNPDFIGVALIHFNTKSVAALAVPLPPLAEQTRIVADVERRLSVVEELEAVASANLQRASRLRQSILHQALTGRT